MKKILGIVVALALLVTFVNRFLTIRSGFVSEAVETSESLVFDDAALENAEVESKAEAETISEAAAQQESDQEEQAVEQTVNESVTHSYTVMEADVTWEEAAAAAKTSGGYLAVITSQEEFDAVAALADQSGALYLWLGAESDGYGNFYWKNGESFSYTNWYPGEPSGSDADGTPETCLCMWKVNGEWSWNDQRNDLISGYGPAAGKIGYVIEYEN
jgi:hypothetical protein